MRSSWPTTEGEPRVTPRSAQWRTTPTLCARHPLLFNDPTYICDTIRREHSPPALSLR